VEIEYQALIEAHKRPDSVQTAIDFFRKLEKTTEKTYSIDASIKFKKGHDVLRVVVKTSSSDETKDKFERTVDLDLNDKPRYDQAFIATAQGAYDFWLENEKTKY
jgi:DNA-binding SARP family transcriptional activator